MKTSHLGLAATALALGTAGFFACEGSGATPAPPPDAAPTAPRRDAALDAAPFDSGIDPDPVPPRPPGVPDGWELSTAYRKQCGFYLPPRRELFPEPIQWVPCSVDVTGHGTSDAGTVDGGVAPCRETKVTWASKGYGDMNVTHGAMDAAGHVLLTQIRVATEGVYYVTGEADGPIRSATFEGRRATCAAYPEWLSEAGSLLSVRQAGQRGTEAILLDDGSPNHRARRLERTDFITPDFRHGKNKLVRFDGTVAIGPLSTLEVTHLPPWNERFGQEGFVDFVDDHFLFFNTQGGDTAIFAYTAQGTYVTLVDDRLPSSRDSAFGTDGKVAAWVHSEGCVSGANCTSIELRTAPFALAPLVGRRVRSIPTTSSTMVSVVSCGRVAIESNEAFRIVDLSSGRAWEIPRRGKGYSFVDEKVLALTCDEVFLTVNLPVPEENLNFRGVRIRLDALGPGLAPD